jgi:heme-degrading monooxygenase HmoA
MARQGEDGQQQKLVKENCGLDGRGTLPVRLVLAGHPLGPFRRGSSGGRCILPGAAGPPAGIIGYMTVVKINAITVPPDSGDELARRFAARAGAVDSQDGFEGFELLKPADERTTWLVVTRWRDDASFQAWLHSPAFGHGHRSAAERSGGESPGPVGVSSELWSYEVAGGSAG